MEDGERALPLSSTLNYSLSTFFASIKCFEPVASLPKSPPFIRVYPFICGFFLRKEVARMPPL